MKKYLMVIARYKDWRQDFFETYMSPRNKEYCALHNFKYIEIKALINCNFDRLIEYFSSGLFYYEHRWSPDKTGKRKGKNHNHGGGFRIKKSSDFEKLFEYVIEL